MPALVSRSAIRISTLATLPILSFSLIGTLTGCSGNSAFTPTPPATTVPTITTQPASQTGYAGETATFTVVATGSAPLTYTWQRNPTQVGTRSSANYTTPVLTASDDGASYTVVVSNAKGSVTSSSAKLSVSLRPASIVTQPLPQTVTVGMSATFSVTAKGSAPLTYQWTRNGADRRRHQHQLHARQHYARRQRRTLRRHRLERRRERSLERRTAQCDRCSSDYYPPAL